MQILQSHGAPTNGTNEVQRLTIGGTPTAGSFQLSFGSMITAAITWSATNATLLANIQAALDTLLGTDVTLVAALSLTAGVGTINVTFQNQRGKMLQPFTMSATSALTGSSPTLAVAVTTPGVNATQRGAALGALLVDVDAVPPVVYQNLGAALLAPSWSVFGGILSVAIGSPAVSGTTAVHAAVTDTGAPVTVTTAITNPDVPRVLTATAGGTAADVKAIQVTVTGTNVYDEVITEALPAFTVNTTGTVTGTKAFKTVTSIAIPAHDGTGATTAVGTGPALGLPTTLTRDTTLAPYLAGVKDSFTAVTFNATTVELNTATLNATLNGGAVVISYYKS